MVVGGFRSFLLLVTTRSKPRAISIICTPYLTFNPVSVKE